MAIITVIAMAPHNDAEMRGFTPCTYQMAEKMVMNDALKYSEVFGIIAKGYGCYFKVMGEGVKLFYKGEQPTPWANYLFAIEQDETEEGFEKDLEQNNLFVEDNETVDLLDNSIRENTDE